MENKLKKEVDIYILQEKDGTFSRKNAYLLIKTLLGVRGRNQISKRLFYLFFRDHDLFDNYFYPKYPIDFMEKFFVKHELPEKKASYNQKKVEIRKINSDLKILEVQKKEKELAAMKFREEVLKTIEVELANLANKN